MVTSKKIVRNKPMIKTAFKKQGKKLLKKTAKNNIKVSVSKSKKTSNLRTRRKKTVDIYTSIILQVKKVSKEDMIALARISRDLKKAEKKEIKACKNLASLQKKLEKVQEKFNTKATLTNKKTLANVKKSLRVSNSAAKLSIKELNTTKTIHIKCVTLLQKTTALLEALNTFDKNWKKQNNPLQSEKKRL